MGHQISGKGAPQLAVRQPARVNGGLVFMKQGEEMNTGVIETTIGDLICAIREAAQESLSEEQDMNELTHRVLMGLLRKRQA